MKDNTNLFMKLKADVKEGLQPQATTQSMELHNTANGLHTNWFLVILLLCLIPPLGILFALGNILSIFVKLFN